MRQLAAAGAGAPGAGNLHSLMAKLQAAEQQLERGNTQPAAGQLGSVINELDAMMQSGRLPPDKAGPVETLASRLIRAITR